MYRTPRPSGAPAYRQPSGRGRFVNGPYQMMRSREPRATAFNPGSPVTTASMPQGATPMTSEHTEQFDAATGPRDRLTLSSSERFAWMTNELTEWGIRARPGERGL